jgi:putative transposase
MVYVAFVIDAYSRRILGWRAATTMKTTLVLDALEQAVWTRHQAGIVEFDGLIHHNDAGSQLGSAVGGQCRGRLRQRTGRVVDRAVQE